MAGLIKIESFDIDVTTSGSTHTLTNDVGNVSNAFVKINSSSDKIGGPTGSTGNANPVDACMGVALTGTNQITFYKGSATSQKKVGEIWRYTGPASGPDEFIVRGRYAVTLTGTSQTQTLSGIVNRNKVVPFLTGVSTTAASVNDYDHTTVAVHINSSGDLVVSRGSGTLSVTAYVEIVEFTGGNWSVGHAVSSSHDGGTEDVTMNTDSTGSGGSTFTVGNWETAFMEATMEGDAGGETGLSDNLGCPIASSATQITWIINQDANARNDGSAYIHIVMNPNMIVKRSSNTNFSEGNGSYTTAPWPVGASTIRSLDDLALEWFCDTSGVGTAHARGRLMTRITAASGTIQTWVHRSGNNVAVYYGVIDLTNVDGSVKPVINSISAQSIPIGGATDLVLSGVNFGTNTGLAKLEISDNATYGSGTVVSQNIDSWADDSIQFDTVLTGILLNQNVYVWVTDSAGVLSSYLLTYYGNPDAYAIITGLLSTTPDHAWSMDNILTDVIQGYDLSVRVGSPGFAALPAVRGATHSGFLSASGQGWDMADSNFMNLSAATKRQVFWWIRLGSTNKAMSAFDEEGGSVNNLIMIMAPGNILTMQLADTSDDNVHAYSGFKLKNNRWYLVHYEFDYSSTKLFLCGIDGVYQSDSFGNPLAATDLDSHSGNVAVGTPETNDEVFGTDVAFPNTFPIYLQWKLTLFGNVLPISEIRDMLFERCALADITISSGTESVMQIALDAYKDTMRADAPICIDIDPCDDGNFELIADNITFEDGASVHVRYNGGSTLTWVNTNGSDMSIIAAPYSGVVNIINTILTTISGIPTGAEWRLGVNDPSPGALYSTELAGEESKTDGSDVVYSDRYSSDTEVVLQILADGFEEKIIYFTLGAASQEVLVTLDVDYNE